jgi:hypothetical protein
VAGLNRRRAAEALRRCETAGPEFVTNFGKFGLDLKSLAIRDSANELFAEQPLDIE